MGSKLEAQMVLKAITDCLCLDFSALGNGWGEALPKVMARLETIVDEGERGFRERNEAERRAVRAEEQLAALRSAVSVLSQGPLRLVLEVYRDEHPDDHMAIWNIQCQMSELLAAASVAGGGQAVEPAAEDETA
ncbi:MAG: hypothetical protein KGL39_24995 [Patescibacteria group bacterium]|nr:hypothetical protein [Patescibacteria group bacterium]